MDEILFFINKRFSSSDANWLNGNCYYFAIILKERFPELEIYYDPIVGHFVAGDGLNFYDAKGLYFGNELILFNKIKQEDPLWYNNIREGCIL